MSLAWSLVQIKTEYRNDVKRIYYADKMRYVSSFFCKTFFLKSETGNFRRRRYFILTIHTYLLCTFRCKTSQETTALHVKVS